jgi:mediator of replication checkpoint protein 1
MLRRKRGADYDLSDSDDDGEARRRMKRKEFARMRKALLEDERIGKIAQNPKREAFLRAIEDRGKEDELDFLDFDDSEVLNPSLSQSQDASQAENIPDSQPDTSMGPPKRKRSELDDVENRLPPHMRRTKSKRPSTLSEVRESLSSLIEMPNTQTTHASDSDSDSDLEIEDDDAKGTDPFATRRSTTQVIDRISLKRQSSSNLSTSSTTKLAFAMSQSTSNFRAPALLRRATSNSTSSTTSASTSATERTAGVFGEGAVKRGGTKTSGVNFFARENERRERVMEVERRREERRVKGAEGRRKLVSNLFGAGSFE